MQMCNTRNINATCSSMFHRLGKYLFFLHDYYIIIASDRKKKGIELLIYFLKITSFIVCLMLESLNEILKLIWFSFACIIHYAIVCFVTNVSCYSVLSEKMTLK